MAHSFPLLSSFFPAQDVCTALLITAFNSLTWKDTLSCQRATTQLCWPLLKQVCLLTLFLSGGWWMDLRQQALTELQPLVPYPF